MKTIFFTLEFKPTKYGSNVTSKVYKVVKNQPVYIGTTNYKTGSFRGHDHEAVSLAVKLGALPKKCMDGSVTGYINQYELNKSFRVFQL